MLFGGQRRKFLTNFVHLLLDLKRSLIGKSFHVEYTLLGNLCYGALYFLENFLYRRLKAFLIDETVVLCFLARCLKFLFHLHLVRLKHFWGCQRLRLLFYRLICWQNLCQAQFLTIAWGYLSNYLFFCLHRCLYRLNNAHSKLLPILSCHLERLLVCSIKAQRIFTSKWQYILPHLEIHSSCLDFVPICLELAWRHLEILRFVP